MFILQKTKITRKLVRFYASSGELIVNGIGSTVCHNMNFIMFSIHCLLKLNMTVQDGRGFCLN